MIIQEYLLRQEFLEILNGYPFLPVVVTQSTESTEADKANVWRIGGKWNVTFHWVFREKWGRKRDKLPFKPRLVKAIEPFARVMFWILELCIQCEALQPFKHGPVHRFLCIAQELQVNAFHSTKTKNPLGKTKILKARREAVQDLSNVDQKAQKTKLRKNPYDPDKVPNMYKLIDTCITCPFLAGNPGSDNFLAKYWEPYESSLSAWNTAFDSPKWTTVFEEDDKLYYRQYEKDKPRRVLIHAPKDVFETLTEQGF